MDNEGINFPRRQETRVPPRRGQIKVKIFAGLAKKVKNAVIVIGQGKKIGKVGTSSSTSPRQSAYTSEGHSDS